MVKLICQLCKKEFFSYPSEIKRRGRYFCSRKCFYKYKWNRDIENNILTCKFCNKEFYKPPSVKKLDRAIYCSNKCRYKDKRKRIKMKCLQCNKEYEIKLNDFKRNIGNKFCSKKCNGLYHKGKNNPQWRGGISKVYLQKTAEREWNKIRRQVYKRDNYQCQVCGQNNITLYCHHIIPWRITQSDNLNNLITVCGSCHRKMEKFWDTLMTIALIKIKKVN